jgi:hypothetical protein
MNFAKSATAGPVTRIYGPEVAAGAARLWCISARLFCHPSLVFFFFVAVASLGIVVTREVLPPSEPHEGSKFVAKRNFTELKNRKTAKILCAVTCKR